VTEVGKEGHWEKLRKEVSVDLSFVKYIIHFKAYSNDRLLRCPLMEPISKKINSAASTVRFPNHPSLGITFFR